ncbi:hypothetical protein MUK42_34008 [Musa troglodytarum]|uniref:Uncharacterized protein n=1 Tax=Musa troglodytarum TaxID=320322 RepID=A0A9E7K7B6_9LILI|nr:hypothetical protein MUK42_34008 [Musa troglodytarum]
MKITLQEIVYESGDIEVRAERQHHPAVGPILTRVQANTFVHRTRSPCNQPFQKLHRRDEHNLKTASHLFRAVHHSNKLQDDHATMEDDEITEEDAWAVISTYFEDNDIARQ